METEKNKNSSECEISDKKKAFKPNKAQEFLNYRIVKDNTANIGSMTDSNLYFLKDSEIGEFASKLEKVKKSCEKGNNEFKHHYAFKFKTKQDELEKKQQKAFSQPITRMRFDVDISFQVSTACFVVEEKACLYTMEQAKKVVEIMLNIIKSSVNKVNTDELKVCILTKDWKVHSDDVKHVLKHGFHVEFLTLFMPNNQISELVEKVNEEIVLKKVFETPISRGEFFKSILVNSPIGGFKPDNQFIKNGNWLMYGGCKIGKTDYYKPTMWLDSNLEEFYMPNLSFSELVETFWLFPNSEKGNKVRFLKIKKEENFEVDIDENELPPFEDFKNYVSGLLKGLQQKRVESTISWKMVISGVKSETIRAYPDDVDEIKRILNEWSMTTTAGNYSSEGFEDSWNRPFKDVKFKILLKYWWIDNQDYKFVLKGRDEDIAKLIYNEYKGDIFMTTKEEGYYYDKKTKLWKGGDYNEIYGYVKKYLESKLVDARNKLNQLRIVVKDENEEGEKKKPLNKLEKERNKEKEKLNKFEEKIGSNRNRKGIIATLSDYCLNENFKNRINANPILLPIKDGKIAELDTGIIRERKQDDYFDFESPVYYTEETKWAEKYFMDLSNGRESLSKHLQKLGLYFCSGNISDKSCYQMVGDGNNGKTLFMEIFDKIIGKLAIKGNNQLICGKNSLMGIGAKPEVVKIKNARTMTFQETEKNSTLCCSTMKVLTGGDSIECRGLYKNDEKFICTAKLLIITNHAIHWNGLDNATKNRVKFIPFDAVFERNDEYRNNILNEENKYLSEIFSLCLKTGHESIKRLKPFDLPEEVIKYGDENINSMDTIMNFLEEEDFKKEDGIIPEQQHDIKRLYDQYRSFMTENRSDFILDEKDFKKEIIKKGFIIDKERKRIGNIRTYSITNLKFKST
jgi:P4 family phage/plasmid primase-like protien